jgi:hypothetical protein
MVLLRECIARRPAGAIETYLPPPARKPSSGAGWIDEIKYNPAAPAALRQADEEWS